MTRHLTSYLSQNGVFFRPRAPDSAQGNEACWIEDCPPPFSIRREFKLPVGTVGVCSQCQVQHFQHAHISEDMLAAYLR
jgi:hypothetical protein